MLESFCKLFCIDHCTKKCKLNTTRSETFNVSLYNYWRGHLSAISGALSGAPSIVSSSVTSMGNYQHTSTWPRTLYDASDIFSKILWHSPFDLRHFPMDMITFQLLYHVFPMSFVWHEHMPTHVLLKQLSYKSLRSCNGKGHHKTITYSVHLFYSSLNFLDLVLQLFLISYVSIHIFLPLYTPFVMTRPFSLLTYKSFKTGSFMWIKDILFVISLFFPDRLLLFTVTVWILLEWYPLNDFSEDFYVLKISSLISKISEFVSQTLKTLVLFFCWTSGFYFLDSFLFFIITFWVNRLKTLWCFYELCLYFFYHRFLFHLVPFWRKAHADHSLS